MTSGPPRAGGAVDAAAPLRRLEALALGPAVDPRGTVRLTGGGSTSRYPANTTVTVPRVFPHGRPIAPSAPATAAWRRSARCGTRRTGAWAIWAEPATLRAAARHLAPVRCDLAGLRRLSPGAPALVGTVGDVPVAADFDGDGSARPGHLVAVDRAVADPQQRRRDGGAAHARDGR